MKTKTAKFVRECVESVAAVVFAPVGMVVTGVILAGVACASVADLISDRVSR